LVDDESDVLSTIEMGLRLNEFNVTSYADPTLALSDFKAGLFDLAILDVRMPKLTGFELYHKLREKEPGIKACFLTAFEAFEEFKRQLPKMDDKHFLQKPISIKDLVNRVNNILGNNDSATTTANGTLTS
jgi:two-component system catabolic regulation response regulator CreB/two-component system response regulator ChvI